MNDKPRFYATCIRLPNHPALRGQPYTINLYATLEEAEADMPKARRKWGHNVFIEERP